MDAKIGVRLYCSRRSDLVSLSVLGLLASLLLLILAWKQGEAAPSVGSPVDPRMRREYYLTTTEVSGSQALTACAPSYHMASLWEIMDTSNLQYNSELGYPGNADQGYGPPSGGYYWGWIRTGGVSSTSSTPGIGNCANWTSDSHANYGTLACLDDNWSEKDMWLAYTETCGTWGRIWCVADHAGKRSYLPVVRKAS